MTFISAYVKRKTLVCLDSPTPAFKKLHTLPEVKSLSRHFSLPIKVFLSQCIFKFKSSFEDM